MSKTSSHDFLAPGARFGHWWNPRDSASNGNGVLKTLPDKCAAGVVAVRDEGHWQLLVSDVRRRGGETPAVPSAQGVERREAIWGETRDESVSLFDGWCVRPRSLLNNEHESVWVGDWRAESWGIWIEPRDMASCVEIEFDIAAAWSERSLGRVRDLDLSDSWNPQARSFQLPESLVRQVDIGDAQLRLCRECVTDSSAEALTTRIRTYFSIDDELPFADIQERWVRPLFELLSFFWADNARVTGVKARDALHGRWLRLHYPEPLATKEDSVRQNATLTHSQFVNLGDLTELGIEFETVLPRFFEWIGKGNAPALTLLIDSQRPLLDHSVGSRLLSAARSLEAYKKTTQGDNRNVNLGSAIEDLLSRSGPIGCEVARLWKLRDQRPFHSVVPELRAKHAAHGHSGGGDQQFASVTELLDLECHVNALQWLLRWQYLQGLEISENHATQLVSESRGYRGMSVVTEQQYRNQ